MSAGVSVGLRGFDPFSVDTKKGHFESGITGEIEKYSAYDLEAKLQIVGFDVYTPFIGVSASIDYDLSGLLNTWIEIWSE